MWRFPITNTAISIHALREEGDSRPCSTEARPSYFYPRPPRGGRPSARRYMRSGSLFLSTPSARRATADTIINDAAVQFLSTPSARRATSRIGTLLGGETFLSTPSARRATYASWCGHISHGFLSTPSARRATRWDAEKLICRRISIHALREEGDSFSLGILPPVSIFLSTPSARRATAKTETKSLFSYKLYNILHEFRRALIYNGSKNYPNHAK